MLGWSGLWATDSAGSTLRSRSATSRSALRSAPPDFRPAPLTLDSNAQGLAPPCAYCFASVVEWTATISDRFVLFWQWNNQRSWRPVFWERRLKTSSTSLTKKCIWWPGLRIFWPWNNLAPLLRWRLHLMTCLTTFSDLEMTWLSWRPGAVTGYSRPRVYMPLHPLLTTPIRD